MKILVIVARGLQAGMVGCYGNSWIDTPSLDALTAGGILFDWHFAGCADPAGARQEWRSGHYHLPVPSGQPRPDAGHGGDLLKLLKEAGIPTYLVLDDSRAAPEEFTAGWEVVERASPTDAEETPLEATLNAAEAALDELGDQPDWLLWLDLATLLPPWHVPEEYQTPYFEEELVEDEEDDDEREMGPEEDDEVPLEPLTPLPDPVPGPIDADDDDLFLRIQGSYAAAVSYLDAGIGQLVELLDNLELGDEVLILVTSDCGQVLGEHGVVGAGKPWLHEEIVHVPLLVRLPGGAEPGRRVSALTQGVDLTATLAQAFGLDMAVQGRSLWPLLRGERGQDRPYVCVGLQVDDSIEWCLRTPQWAFLLPVQPQANDRNRTVQLYVKPDDRWEVNNVVQHHLEWCEALEQTLRAFVVATSQAGPLEAPPLPDLIAK
jgi:arylsulfatase A-like enzyme